MQHVLPITLVVWIFALINFYLYNAFRAKEEVASVTLYSLIGTILFYCVIVPLVCMVAQLHKRKKRLMKSCLVVIITLIINGGIGYVSLEEIKLFKEKPLLIPTLIYFVGFGWFISAISILLIQPKTIQNKYLGRA